MIQVAKAMSKTEMVVENVINSIARGEYHPGDKLPPENDYVQAFSVSRVTVREAFKRLSTMGVVSIRQGDGTFVNPIKPFEIKNSLLPLLTANRKMIEDVYETRLGIELYILELTIQRIGPIHLKKMKTLLSEMESYAASGDFEAYSKLDDKFHDAISEICDNTVLQGIYESLAIVRRQNIRTSNTSTDALIQSVREHGELLHAIELHDISQAKSVLKNHLLFSKHQTLSAL